MGGVKEMIENKDEHIVSIFKEFSHNFCEFMFSYLKDFEAELIIIGGNIAKSHSLFLDQIIKNWQEMGMNIPISIINKTDEASIVGSAYLFDNIFWREIRNKLPSV
jgi:glucokinase